MRRFLLWTIASIVGLVLVVLIGLGLYTQTAHFHEWARTQLLASLRPVINGEVALERISGSLWSGLSFHNLAVRQQGAEVLRVPLGTIAFDLVAQIISYVRSETVRVNAVSLQAPVLTLEQNAQGEWNISRLIRQAQPTTPAQSSALSVSVPKIQITDGHIRITPASGVTTQLTPFTATGSLTVQPAGMLLDLSALSFVLAHPGIPHLQWTGGMTYDASNPPARLSLPHVELRTPQSHVRISGSVDNFASPVVALTANVEQLSVADLRVQFPTLPLQQDLTGMVAVNGPLSALEITMTAQAPDGAVTTKVVADLTQTPLHYEGTLSVQELHIPKAIQVANASGRVSGQATFSGQGTSIAHGTFTTTMTDLHVRQRQIGKVTTSGSIARQHLQLNGEAEGALGAIQWQGQIGLAPPLSYDINLKARNVSVDQVMPQPPSVPVTVNIEARVHGSGTAWQDLNSTVEATLLPSRVGNITDIRGRVEGSVRSGHLTLNTLSLVAQGTTLSAQGQLAGVQSSDRGTFTYTLQVQDVAPWLALFGQSGSGAIDVQGKATGTLADVRTTGSVNAANLRIANQSLQHGTLTYTGSGIGSPRPQGQANAILRDVNVGIPWQTIRIQLAVAGTQPLTAQIEFNGQDAAQRRQYLKAQVQYTPEHTEALVQQGAVQLPTGVWQISQPARVVVENQTLRVERLQLQQGKRQLKMNGTLSTTGTQDLQLQIANLSLAEVQSLAGRDPVINGELSATASVQGTAAQPLIKADITTSALRVASQDFAGFTAQLAYRDARFGLSAQLRQDNLHTLSVEGGIPLALSWTEGKVQSVFGEADFNLYSQGLSLVFLNQWSSAVRDIQGVVGIDVRVQGPLSALTAQGSAQLQNGQARIPQLGIQVTEISVEAMLANNTVQLTTLQARSGKGRLTGNGTIALPRGTDPPLSLTLRAETLQVIRTDQYSAALSGRLLASGSLQRPVVTGELTVEDTVLRPVLTLFRSQPEPPDPTITVVRNTQQDATVVSTSQTTGAPEEGTTSTAYDRLTLDVVAKIPRDTWINVDDGSVELRGEVRVRKAAYEPLVLVGTVESVRGWYSYRGRKFRVDRGYIYFTGGTPIDPGLDVVARYTLREYRIDVIVAGTARKPQLTLRSEPALEQADILSLLVFGKTTAALSSGERTKLQAQALQSAAGYLANDLRQALAKELGIDNLEFDVGQTLNQSRIGAGKYITDDVFISTSQQLSDASNREFAIEYSITENWQIKASTTTRGNDAIDVFWQKRY